MFGPYPMFYPFDPNQGRINKTAKRRRKAIKFSIDDTPKLMRQLRDLAEVLELEEHRYKNKFSKKEEKKDDKAIRRGLSIMELGALLFVISPFIAWGQIIMLTHLAELIKGVH